VNEVNFQRKLNNEAIAVFTSADEDSSISNLFSFCYLVRTNRNPTAPTLSIQYFDRAINQRSFERGAIACLHWVSIAGWTIFLVSFCIALLFQCIDFMGSTTLTPTPALFAELWAANLALGLG